MTGSINRLFLLLALTFGCGSASTVPPDVAAPGPGPVSIIFDTDMDTDCDDAGALAMLHALADAGEVKILATVVSSKFAYSAPCVEAINRYYGRGDLPIGELYGNMYQLEYGSPEVGFPDILTTSYAGGHKYTTCHYRYDGRQYSVQRTERWTPEPIASGDAVRLNNLADELARHLDALRANPAQNQVWKVIGECETISEAHGPEVVANVLKQIALRKPDLREQALSFLMRYVSLVEHGDFIIEFKLIELKRKKQ